MAEHNEPSLRDKLRNEVLEVEAAALVPHYRRGALIIVGPSCALLDVALAVAEDRAEVVEEWLATGVVYRPSVTQIAQWCMDEAVRLEFVITQPFVLARLKKSASGSPTVSE